MSWFLSDELPEIPADILERLQADQDDGYGYAPPERSSVLRVIAINQQLRWRGVQLEADLTAAKTNMEYMRKQIEDLVMRLRRTGHEPSRNIPKVKG